MIRKIGVLLCGLVLIVVWSASSASAGLSKNLGAASPPPTVVARNYFDGLVSDGTGATHGKAETFAQPGSLAAAYAQEQGTFGSALPSKSTSSKTKGGFSLCNVQKVCAQFTALSVHKGKLVTFDVGGKPLAQLFRVLTQSVTDGPLTFTGRSAYLSSTGKLLVVVDIRNDGNATLLPDSFATVWIDPTGRQQMNAFAGVGESAPEVNGHAIGTMLLGFDGSGGQIGGQLIIKAYDNHPPPDQPQAHYQGAISLG
jgi:hypothetical protein